MEFITDTEQLYFDIESTVIDLESGGLNDISVGLTENVSATSAMGTGWIIGTLVCWFVGWVIAMSYSSSPSHSILAKMAGWFLALPVAFTVGNTIGEAATPHWWTVLRTPLWAGYPFALIWFAVAILGHEDRLDAIRGHIDHAINKGVGASKSRHSASETRPFVAPDPFAAEQRRK